MFQLVNRGYPCSSCCAHVNAHVTTCSNLHLPNQKKPSFNNDILKKTHRHNPVPCRSNPALAPCFKSIPCRQWRPSLHLKGQPSTPLPFFLNEGVLHFPEKRQVPNPFTHLPLSSFLVLRHKPRLFFLFFFFLADKSQGDRAAGRLPRDALGGPLRWKGGRGKVGTCVLVCVGRYIHRV